MDNPIKMDDLGGFPIFLETPIYIYKPYTKGRLPRIQSSFKYELIEDQKRRWSTKDWNPGTLLLMDAVLSLLTGAFGTTSLKN